MRLGPFDRSIAADRLTVTSNGAAAAFTLSPRGDAAWLWVKGLPSAAAFHLHVAIDQTPGSGR